MESQGIINSSRKTLKIKYTLKNASYRLHLYQGFDTLDLKKLNNHVITTMNKN